MALSQTDLDEIEELVKGIVEEKIRNLPSKNEFFEWMDKLMKELKDIRDEITIVSQYSSDHSDKLEKLEKIHPLGQHAAAA